MKFIDEVQIKIKSGAGGDGCVAFRREKYVANGGPDGGDGGKGGDVVFEVDQGENSLSAYRKNKTYKAQNGNPGEGGRRHGKSGADIVLKVPPGTVIRDAASGSVIADMSIEERQIILPGGQGGLGNMHYATSRMQAPKYAKPGEEAKELDVVLELKLIADVGLVGFPNAGKSTLLSVMSNARPKIADYPFTTLDPMLGVVDTGCGTSFVMADIPGLIEGASNGTGLGHEFLRHIERNKLLIHMVDITETDGRDPIDAINIINEELRSFSEALLEKPMVICLNKCDAVDPAEAEALKSEVESRFNTKCILLSCANREGLDELKSFVSKTLQELPQEKIIFTPDYKFIEKEIQKGYTISINDDGEYVIEGPKIEKMLGYTNLESEKGFLFFSKFINSEGIVKELRSMGCGEGDTVRMYGHAFDFFD